MGEATPGGVTNQCSLPAALLWRCHDTYRSGSAVWRGDVTHFRRKREVAAPPGSLNSPNSAQKSPNSASNRLRLARAPREPPMSGGRWRRPAEMVQPGPEADPALAEALQRLRAENRELRGALCHCTESLRQRLEELRKLQLQRRGERELLRGRWGQARDLVLHLRGQRRDSTGDTPRDTPGDTRDTPGDTKDTPGDTKDTPGDVWDAKDTSGDIRDTLRDTRDISRDTPDTSTKPPEATPCSVSLPLEDIPAVPEPPQAPSSTPLEPSSEEQLKQRLAEAEAELVTLRARVAVAELRAQDVSRAAELQLQGLRRQLEQDKAQVQAQVTSLLGELRESQNRLERSRAEREHLERRARSDAERCQQLEEVTQGHQVQLDQLRLQVTNLETALRVERRGATEEKRKLVQLQAAYHHLFQEYDAHIKASLEGDKRSQEQLRAAEAALALKQDLIDHLKAEAERQRAALETIPVLQAQADIYRADFEAERAAREQLHGQREALQEELNQLRLRLGGDGARARLEEMRNRHSEPPPAPVPGRGFGGLLPPAEEGPDLCCPKCQYKAPDMDTLQIHVMDCIK
ncbi:NF-kappa-B essential modulator isoform X3 [Parus major]|uniref:NF-kappa-B essential modulator isoform X3 n=1 Tax=Parus major TaxID=9157 RepID=UPI0007713855|nr:NF-kappa-B essential modulator isoform X3 [Parus major]